MNRWPRTSVLPLWSIRAFLFLYVLIELPLVIVEWSFLLRYPTVAPPLTEFLAEHLAHGTAAGQVLIALVAVFYGLYRGVTFHPYFRPDYREWLERTPWTRSMPLPLGPVHLVWEDAIAPVLLGLLALRHEDMPVLGPAIISAAAYLAVLGAGFWGTGLWSYGFSVFFLLGLVLRLKPFPEAAAGVAVATYFVCLLGLRACFAAFPWKERTTTIEFRELFDLQKQQDKEMGWPFKQLSPVPTTVCMPAVLGLFVSLLVGWWLYAFAANLSDAREQAEFLGVAYHVIGVVAALVRCLVYICGRLPPISLWGRVRTLRLIIPGYDQIFLAPLSIVAVVSLANLSRKHFDLLVVAPVGVFLILLIAFNMGPTFRNWHTTGKHRMVAAMIQSQQSRKL